MLQEGTLGLIKFQCDGIQQILVIRTGPGVPRGEKSIDSGRVPFRLGAYGVKTADIIVAAAQAA
jgi:hypothetical protein